MTKYFNKGTKEQRIKGNFHLKASQRGCEAHPIILWLKTIPSKILSFGCDFKESIKEKGKKETLSLVFS